MLTRRLTPNEMLHNVRCAEQLAREVGRHASLSARAALDLRRIEEFLTPVGDQMYADIERDEIAETEVLDAYRSAED